MYLYTPEPGTSELSYSVVVSAGTKRKKEGSERYSMEMNLAIIQLKHLNVRLPGDCV